MSEKTKRYYIYGGKELDSKTGGPAKKNIPGSRSALDPERTKKIY